MGKDGSSQVLGIAYTLGITKDILRRLNDLKFILNSSLRWKTEGGQSDGNL
jgi:hypothetical protein